MGELLMSAPVAGLSSKTRIMPDDVLMLRHEVFGDGVVTRGEAESLFALDRSCPEKCAEWSAFFVEAVTDYIVHHEDPEDYISDENADWLIRATSSDGVVDSPAELELLIHVLEKARSAPARLSAFALSQVAHAVVDGKGPVATGGVLTPGVVGKPEIDLLRRILYAAGSDGNVGITRAEAEVLFDINDRTDESRNDPAWNELFVKAIANFVMCASGYQPPKREEALAQEHFFDDATPHFGSFFSRMVSGGVSGILGAYRAADDVEEEYRELNAARAAQDSAARSVDADEARWLAARIGRHGPIHSNERALIAFLERESPSVSPELKPLLAKVAKAGA